MYNMAASKLTCRPENQHGSKISNMPTILSYMAAISTNMAASKST
jgi:hypothetical protein